MEDILDVMYARESVREFSDEAVDDEQIEAILKAAMAAPSVQDLRPWHFVAVRKRKTEVDPQVGTVAQIAASQGIDTPLEVADHGAQVVAVGLKGFS